MKGSEFLRKLKKLGSENGTKVEINQRRGKGGHVTLCYGNKQTIIPNLKNELKTGTYNAILKQLGIDEDELR
jgi:predicted RNA binding protein YcfA (HicA-like mRNA interferase family)